MNARRIIILPLILSSLIALIEMEVIVRRILSIFALLAILYAFFILLKDSALSWSGILSITVFAAFSFLLMVLTWMEVGW